MKKLIMPSSIKQIKDLINKVDGFIIGINNLSVNMPTNYSLEEIININNLVKENNKELFISINKNMHKDDLTNLENSLIKIDELNIKGVLFYDLAILNLKKRLNLKTNLVWAAEHLTTNYATINYYNNLGVNYTNVSFDITLEEILEIKKNTKSILMINVFGYLPMYTSLRRVVKNYVDKFDITKDITKTNYIEKEGYVYPVIDNTLGSTIYSSLILSSLSEMIIYEKNNIEYVILNSFDIKNETFENVVDLYNEVNEENKEILEGKIEELLPNTDKGFLYKGTIYKVKK